MEARRPLSRVTYTLLDPEDARRPVRRARRHRVLTSSGAALALFLTAHALVDTTVALGSQQEVTVPLDRAFERTYTWHQTVQLAAPGGAWVWPSLVMRGESLGTIGSHVPEIPELRWETFVDGERVTGTSFGGDFGADVQMRDIYGCKPRSTCDWPHLAWGFRSVDVQIVATISHDGDPRASGLAYRYTLGPHEVVVDRCPCW